MANSLFEDNAPNTFGGRLQLERPQISALLQQSLQCQLATVVAGAGYGKTQAVYSFLRSHDIPTTWLQISKQDNLVSRFWENYTHSVSKVNANIAVKIHDIGFPETETQFNRYLSALEDEATPAKKYALVCDDFHLLHNPVLLSFLERLVDIRFRNAVTNRITILISRTAPAINTVKLMSKGLLFDINQDDLRFSKEEIVEYFRILNVNPSHEALDRIYHDTGGWAFAINLMGLHLSHAPTQENQAISAMKLNIFKLIESEVFFAASEKLREFLIRLSLVGDMPFELAKRLANDDEKLVEELAGIGSFIHNDTYLGVFRIHHLFRDYLKRKQHMLSETETRETYRTAARWFDENDRKIDAMTYYEKVKDYDAIVDIAYMFPQVIPQDVAAFVLNLFDGGFGSLLESNPIAFGLYSRLLLSAGRIEEAIAVVLSTIDDFEKRPESKFNCRVLLSAYNNLGFARMLLCPKSGDYEFWHCFEKADHYYNLGAPFGEHSVRGPVTSVNIGSYACRVGSTNKGDMERYIESLDILSPHLTHSMNGCMYGQNDMARTEIAYFRGEIKEAEKFAHQTFFKAKEYCQRDIESRAVFYLIRIELQNGDYAKIQRYLKQFEALLELKESPLSPAIYDLATGWYHAQLGRNERIAEWLKNGFENSMKPSLMIDFETLVRLRCHWADKKYHEILAFLESQNTDDAVLMVKLEFKILEAVCLYRINEKPGAFRALREAYELSSSNSFDMMFIEFGNNMRTISRAAMKAEGCSIPNEWLTRINKKSATYAKKLAFVISEYRKSNHLGDEIQLSMREIEVLTDLYHGLSRSEIAVNRELSINTVKSLLQIIYAKLGAENNIEVIRIALDMKLIK
ncbi:MAG: LuxR C-terminal-related transcriptional regulator [Clostridiales Family XIII bacterium]|jgi:LuxR family maltose regulon positive regulatory protein|nr:LuxR C-terminal-related transcriptional regulator [Clostridiales Family XIII bacterium]